MSGSGYDFLSRLLHRMALQSRVIAEVSFDLENMLVKRDKSFNPGAPVFVSGLARSGTTILMRYLYETGLFRSLTYHDMPFVLMPNTWKKIAGRKSSTELKERAHKDGIMVGVDSPEAFEEIFWKVFTGRDYIGKDRLNLYSIEGEVSEKFRNYVELVLRSSDLPAQTRYLSKNNNNALRFASLQKCLPDAQIIIPFREPLQHALSLLEQHEHFCKVQAEDPFSLDYMNWLGHYEFGLNQKSFFLGDPAIFDDMQRYEKTDLNFWLLNWKNYYQYVHEHHAGNCIFFHYEKFCSEPSLVIARLFEKINIDVPPREFVPFGPQVNAAAGFDQQLLDECELIYKNLEREFGSWFDQP